MINITKIVTIFLLLLTGLYARQLYLWTEREQNKFYCFDRETEILLEHELSKSHYKKIYTESLTYVSNFAVASYRYHPSPAGQAYRGDYREKGGFVLLDVRDGNFREIEISDLINGYFSSGSPRRDKSRRYVLFLGIKVLDIGIETDAHEVDYFRWDPNGTSPPEQITLDEFSENEDRTVSVDRSVSRLEKFPYLYDYKPIKRRIEIPNKEAISNQIDFRDHVFLLGNNMEVWAHKENRFYTLRDASDVPADEDLISIHMISIDGMRSIRIGWK